MTDQDIMDIAALIYGKWSEAMDILEFVKREKNDGSPDWDEFHVLRMNNATAAESKWLGIRDRYNEQHREVIRRSFGI